MPSACGIYCTRSRWSRAACCCAGIESTGAGIGAGPPSLTRCGQAALCVRLRFAICVHCSSWVLPMGLSKARPAAVATSHLRATSFLVKSAWATCSLSRHHGDCPQRPLCVFGRRCGTAQVPQRLTCRGSEKCNHGIWEPHATLTRVTCVADRSRRRGILRQCDGVQNIWKFRTICWIYERCEIRVRWSSRKPKPNCTIINFIQVHALFHRTQVLT